MKGIVGVTCITLIFASQAQTVVVVGSGLAGLSAAIEAARAGASVIVLEKEARVGGNSLCASSGINAVNTPPQQEAGIFDSCDYFARDTLKSGKGLSNKKLVNLLVSQSHAAWVFLHAFGVDLSVLCKAGGHSIARTHRAQEKDRVASIGTDIIQALVQAIKKDYPGITILTGARVTSLISDEHGGVAGVRYVVNQREPDLKKIKNPFTLSDCESSSNCIEWVNGFMLRYDFADKITQHERIGEISLSADAVILATGGFCGQVTPDSMLAQYRPDLLYLATTNGGFADGDGITLAQKIGAQLVDMDKVQIHPTGFVDPRDPLKKHKFLAPESLRASGGILLNNEGRRFVNELDTRDNVTAAILANCKPYHQSDGPVTAHLLLNEAGALLFQKKVLEFYMKHGLIRRFESSRDFALVMNIDPIILEKTLTAYAAAAKTGKDVFGKTTFPITFSCDEPIYSMLITPCLHYCMGGVVFDEQARVIGQNGPISRLFAAGEVTGGLHGANRLAGNSLLECVVFGRIAGHFAAVQ